MVSHAAVQSYLCALRKCTLDLAFRRKSVSQELSPCGGVLWMPDFGRWGMNESYWAQKWYDQNSIKMCFSFKLSFIKLMLLSGSVVWALFHIWRYSSEHNRQDLCYHGTEHSEVRRRQKKMKGQDNLRQVRQNLAMIQKWTKGNYDDVVRNGISKEEDLNWDQTITNESAVQRSGCKGILDQTRECVQRP